MNREIKFRAWDKNNKEIYEHPFGYIEFYKDSLVVGFDDGDLKLEGDDVILMQYTGLKDKQGKEIYEGDILKGKGFNGEVDIWEAVNLCYFHHWQETESLMEENGDIEIIGNIYENPDLIK